MGVPARAWRTCARWPDIGVAAGADADVTPDRHTSRPMRRLASAWEFIRYSTAGQGGRGLAQGVGSGRTDGA